MLDGNGLIHHSSENGD